MTREEIYQLIVHLRDLVSKMEGVLAETSSPPVPPPSSERPPERLDYFSINGKSVNHEEFTEARRRIDNGEAYSYLDFRNTVGNLNTRELRVVWISDITSATLFARAIPICYAPTDGRSAILLGGYYAHDPSEVRSVPGSEAASDIWRCSEIRRGPASAYYCRDRKKWIVAEFDTGEITAVYFDATHFIDPKDLKL